MHPRGTFEEALEFALRALREETEAETEPISAPPPRPPESFVFLQPGLAASIGAFRQATARGQLPASQRTGPAPVEPYRPVRHLTSAERGALDGLIGLGADLGPDFTLAELRSAFRSLAFHYHPDRYQAASAAERARLSQVFSQMNDQYRCLLAVAERV